MIAPIDKIIIKMSKALPYNFSAILSFLIPPPNPFITFLKKVQL